MSRPAMQLAELFRRAGLPLPEGVAAIGPGAERVDIGRLTADSRDADAGTLFAALPGHGEDGRRFIADAVERGAVAVLAPIGTRAPETLSRPVPILTVDEPRQALARLAAAIAGPAPETVVAVTGTNGKTSTVEFCRQLWTLSAKRAASLGTLGLRAPDGVSVGDLPALTTPDPIRLAEALASLAASGIGRVAMEASSHGLAQGRLDGLAPKAAGFTNLTRDHLDYHGTETAYRAAKLRLFDTILPRGAAAVVNADADRETVGVIADIASARALRLVTVGETGDAIRLLSHRALADGQRLAVEADGVRREIVLRLIGRYQADNALLAAALVAAADERPIGTVLDRLELLQGVRGRLQHVATLPNGSAAYVDYAHTPDGLETMLRSVRPHASGRIVLVFGAGGDRDRGKRPMMGEIARRGADTVIVTDDNPRHEDPGRIRAEILTACPDAIEIGDRRSAIGEGLSRLAPGDVLVVAGKGHETGQIVGGAVLPFDDADAISRLAGSSSA